MKPWVLITIGILFSIVFGVFSISTGMWGCGGICMFFVVLFWCSVALIPYGIYKKIKSRKIKNIE